MRKEFPRKIKTAAIARAAGHCDVDGCEKKHFAKGYCNTHFLRWKRHGNPLAKVATPPGNARAFLISLPLQGHGCTIWPHSRDQNGYARIGAKRGETGSVCRIICERIYGPRGKSYDAAHSCGNGHLGCVSPWHLEWKTRKENMADTLRHGTRLRKLTEDQVIRIRQLATEKTKQEIADEFGVTRQAIGWIIGGKGWLHVA